MCLDLCQQRARAWRVLTLACAIFLLLGIPVFALDPGKSITHYIRDQWLSEHGLPESQVQDLAQTPDGYLWLATAMGLVRFDGVRFVVLNRSNAPALRSNQISRLFVDSRGALWVGTIGGGVSFFHQEVSKNYSLNDGLLSNVVTGITEDSEGNMWIATEGGINQLVHERFKTFSVKDGLPDRIITSIYGSKSGNLWIGTSNGISLYKNGTFKNFNTADQLSIKGVRTIFEDSKGNVWIGTRGDGLNLMRDGVIRNFTKKEGLAGNYVSAIYEDSHKTLWFGTAEGISRMANDKISNLTAADGIPYGIYSFLEDKEGSLWVATDRGGVLRMKDPKFDSLTKKDGLSSDSARTLFEDSRGRIWLGSDEGLNKLENGKVTIYTTRDGLRTNSVLSVAEDSQGGIWAGTSEKGLDRLHNNRWSTYVTGEGSTLALFKDSMNQLWIATWGAGLYLWKDGKFQVFTTEHGLSDNRISAIAEDQAGNLWIGTALGGLNRYKNGRFDFFPMKETILSPDPVFVDHEGIVWIGSPVGLFRFHNGAFYHYTAGNGLFEGDIWGIVEDDMGRLWVHTTQGLFCISRKDLNDVAAGKTGVVRGLWIFDAADGVYEAGGPAMKSKDGRLWFCSRKNVLIVDPTNIPLNRVPPPVIVEEMQANEERLEQTRWQKSALSLPPGKEKFEFRYAALSFYAPQKVKFRYMLEGLDRTWNDAGTRRVAYYTNLAPGNYRFRVIACNNDGVWNLEGASLSFYLQPHFYQTFWFYLSCAGLVLLAALSLHRLRLRQVRRQFDAVLAERGKISREIHDSVAQGLTAISLQIRSAQDWISSSPEKAGDCLQMARETARATHEDARRLVQDLRPRALAQDDLPGALKKIVTESRRALPVEFHFAISGSPRKLSNFVEDNLLRIVQEAVNNAIKHSGASVIEIRLDYQPRLIAVRISDNGCGFDPSKVSIPMQGSFGLTGMAERAKHLGGKLRIEKRPESGTEVVVTVPFA